MEVLLAENLGFCYGVKRAINLAKTAAIAEKAYTLGPIIHNPQVVTRLEQEGVFKADSLADVKNQTIIIRSHGVGPDTYEEIEKKRLKLVDATCPHVKKAQLSAKTLFEEGYTVLIVGEKEHPEVKSIFEWAGKKATIVETEAEAKNLPHFPKLGIVAQTTFSCEKFQKIVMIVLEKSTDIKILRTICTATDHRQKAAIALAKEVDLMLVIGGKNSANTTRLAEICKEKCTTYHIETSDEIDTTWFSNIQKIGITAGASTPDWIIKEVYLKCKTWNHC